MSFYIKFNLEIIPDIKNVKNLSESQQKEKEGELILSKLTPTDELILLDENGTTFSSVGFSDYLQKFEYVLHICKIVLQLLWQYVKHLDRLFYIL